MLGPLTDRISPFWDQWNTTQNTLIVRAGIQLYCKQLSMEKDSFGMCVGSPGSMHYARVLRVSVLRELVANGWLFPDHTTNIGGQDVGYYLLGDATYPMQSWHLKPYSDTG